MLQIQMILLLTKDKIIILLTEDNTRTGELVPDVLYVINYKHRSSGREHGWNL